MKNYIKHLEKDNYDLDKENQLLFEENLHLKAVINDLKFIKIGNYIININEILFIEHDEYHCRLLVYLKNYNEVNTIYNISNEEFERIFNILTKVCITTE